MGGSINGGSPNLLKWMITRCTILGNPHLEFSGRAPCLRPGDTSGAMPTPADKRKIVKTRGEWFISGVIVNIAMENHHE